MKIRFSYLPEQFAGTFLVLFFFLSLIYLVPYAFGIPLWVCEEESATIDGQGFDYRGISYSDIFDPMRDYFRRQQAEGPIPYWTSTQLLGLPLIDQADFQVMNPLERLAWQGGGRWRAFLLCAYLALAGAGVYRLCRTLLGVRPPGALAGAAIYAMGGSAFFSFDYPSAVMAILCLPYLVLGGASLIHDRARGSAFLIVVLAGAIQGVGGQPQYAFMALVTVAGYCAFNLVAVSRRLEKAALLVLAGVLAAAIAAPQIVPFAKYQLSGDAYSIHSLQSSYNLWKTSPLNFFSFVCPWVHSLRGRIESQEDFGMTWGLLPSALILAGILGTLWMGRIRTGARPQADASAILAERCTVAFFATMLALFFLQNTLPINPWPFSFVNVNKYSPPAFALFGSLVAALGVEYFWIMPRRLAVVALFAAAAVPLLGLGLFTGKILRGPDLRDFQIEAAYLILAPLAILAGLMVCRVRAGGSARPVERFGFVALTALVLAELLFMSRLGLPLSYDAIRIAVYAAMAASAAFLCTNRARWVRLCAGLALVLHVGLLGVVGARTIRSRQGFDRVTKLCAFLDQRYRAQGFRHRAISGSILTPQRGAKYGILTIQNRNPVIPLATQGYFWEFLRPEILTSNQRTWTLLDFYGIDPTPLPDDPEQWASFRPYQLAWPEYFLHRRIFNLLGVALLIDREDGQLPRILRTRPEWSEGLKPVELPPDLGEFVAYEDTRALPRAYFAECYGAVAYTSDGWSARQWMRQNERILPDVPVVELRPQNLITFETVASLPEVSSGDARPIHPARFEDDREGRLEVWVDARSKGLVVVNEQFHPSWRAWVNDEQRVPVRVNGTMLGVVINRPGETRVRFRFDPGMSTLGALSFLGAIATAAMAVAISVRRPSLWYSPRRSSRSAP